jgi:acylpyruvate hydrolase
MSLANFREIGRKIVCVGRNYSEHAKELGNPLPKKPLFFVKTTNSYVTEGNPIETPPDCKNLQQEVELGVIISKLAKNVRKEEAMDFVGGYTVALDM